MELSALAEARHLLAMRAHRKVVADNLRKLREEARMTLQTATYNDNSYEVFGTRTDQDVADRLTQLRERMLDDLTWAINRLEKLNAEEAA